MSELTPEQQQEMIKQQCPFCRIAAGTIPSKEVYSDDLLMGVLDINPAVKGHTVIFPKEHYMMLPQVPPDTFVHLFKRTAKVCGALKKGLLASGTTLFIATGQVAGQQAYHLTVHLIPRDVGDELKQFTLPKKQLPAAELEKLKPALQQHITQRMVQMYQQIGRDPPQVKQAAQQQVSMEQIIQFLEANQQVKQLLLQDPQRFEKLLETNPQLYQIFAGVDLVKLSQILKQGGAQ